MSGIVFTLQSLEHVSFPTTVAGKPDVILASCTLVREWWRRYRSRLELASYSHDQRKDLGFATGLDNEIGKPFWRN